MPDFESGFFLLYQSAGNTAELHPDFLKIDIMGCNQDSPRQNPFERGVKMQDSTKCSTQLSSTSPHRAIWLKTSTRLASLASSTVSLPSTNASAITNDLVTCTARSNPVLIQKVNAWIYGRYIRIIIYRRALTDQNAPPPIWGLLWSQVTALQRG